MSGLIEIILFTLSVILYVLSQGTLFGRRFKGNKLVFGLLIIFTLTSSAYLLVDIYNSFGLEIFPPTPLTSAEQYRLRGDEFLLRHRYDEAISDFRSAIALKAELSEAYVGLGKAYFAQKNYDEALESLDTAVRQSPKLQDATHLREVVMDTKTDKELELLWSDIDSRHWWE